MNKVSKEIEQYNLSEKQEINNILSSIRELIAEEVKAESVDNITTIEKNNNKNVLELTNSIDDIGLNNKYKEVGNVEGDIMINLEESEKLQEAAVVEDEQVADDVQPATPQPESVAAGDEGNADSVSKNSEVAEEAASAAGEGGADAINSDSEAKTVDDIMGENSVPEIDEAMLEDVNDNVLSAHEEDISEKDVSDALKDGVVSEEVLAKSAEALSTIDDIANSNSKNITPSNIGAKTVDEMMQEILRPLLKDWLDANLPSLVKWVVTEQVEKIIKQKLGEKQ